MNIEYINDLIIVSEDLSYNKAAERLNISAPGLKKRINQIESYFGTKIFLPSPRGLVITERGKHIISELKNINVRLEYLKSPNEALKIGILSNMSLQVYQFFNQLDGASIQMVPDRDELIRGLKAGTYHIVVAELGDEDIAYQLWFEEAITIITSKSHAFSSMTEVTVNDIKNKKILMHHHAVLPKRFKDNHLLYEWMDNRESILSKVAVSDAIAVCPLSYAEKLNMNLYHQVKLKDVKRTVVLYYTDKKILNLVKEI